MTGIISWPGRPQDVPRVYSCSGACPHVVISGLSKPVIVLSLCMLLCVTKLLNCTGKFTSREYFRKVKIEHDCNEQSYQYDKAKDHGFDDLAEEIRGMDEPMEMKKATKKIKKTEEWKSEAPDKLWDLISKKYNEHPLRD